MRTETRKERYLNKMANATSLPFSVATTNFSEDRNVAFLARAIACFGGKTMHVIGKIPNSRDLLRFSGGHSRFLEFIQHKNPLDFLSWVRKNEYILIAAELADKAVNIHELKFPLDKKLMFVTGNEMAGIPVELINAANILTYIPMPGFGYCLNTSQTANILLYELNRQVANGK